MEGAGNRPRLCSSIRRADLEGSIPTALPTGLSNFTSDLTVVYHRELPTIFTDGFESGDTSAWTHTVP